MANKIKYTFEKIDFCNMCKAPKRNFKVLGRRLNIHQGAKPRNKIGVATTVVKCLNCGLIFSNPQPIPEKIEDHYNISPENYWDKSYFVISDNYFSKEIKKLKTLTDIQKNARALDIGAGIGKCMKTLEKEGFDSYGIEPSGLFYKRAIEKMGINPDKIKMSSIEKTEFQENYFDFITFGATLEHLYNPSMALKKALKWLKPKGFIHIEVPSSSYLISKMANLYYKIIGTDYVVDISPMHPPYHLYEFSPESFKKNGVINNYKMVDCQYYVCQIHVLPKILNISKPLMKYSNTGMELCVWLTKEKHG